MKWKLRLGRRAATAAPREGDAPPSETDQFHGEVFGAEIRYLEDRWRSIDTERSGIDEKARGGPPTIANNLVGLALSGGGIRSATFNLGLLQSLHRHGVFRHVDYLSTVSGGGFLGSSLSTLMAQKARRDEPEPLTEFPMPDSERQAEAPEVTYLRNNSNYLASSGLLDYLRLVGVLIRGILLNFLVLMPLIFAGSMIVLLAYGQLLLERIQEDDDAQRLAGLLERYWTDMESLEDARVSSLTTTLEERSMLAAHRDQTTADVLRWLDGTTSKADPLIVGGPTADLYEFHRDANPEAIVRSLLSSRTLHHLDALEEMEAVAAATAVVGKPEDVLAPLVALHEGGALRFGVEQSLATLTRVGLIRRNDPPGGVEGGALGGLGLFAQQARQLETTYSLEPGRNRRHLLHELYVHALYKPEWLQAHVRHRSGASLAYWEFVELAGVRYEIERKARQLPTKHEEDAAEVRRKAIEANEIPPPPTRISMDELYAALGLPLSDAVAGGETTEPESPEDPFLVPMPENEELRAELRDRIDAALEPLLAPLNERLDPLGNPSREPSAIGPAADKVARALFYQGLLNPAWLDAYVVGVVGEAVSAGKQLSLLWKEAWSWIVDAWNSRSRRSTRAVESPKVVEVGEEDKPGRIPQHKIRAYRSHVELAETPGRWNPHLIRLPWTVKIGLLGLLWIALFPLLLFLRRLLAGVGVRSALLILSAAELVLMGALVTYLWFDLPTALAGLALVGVLYRLMKSQLLRLLSRTWASSCLLVLGAVPVLLLGTGLAFLLFSFSQTDVLVGLALVGVYWLLRFRRRRAAPRGGGGFWLLFLRAAPSLLVAAGLAYVWQYSGRPTRTAVLVVAAGLALIASFYWLLQHLRRVKNALWWRDLYERSFSTVLILVAGVAWVELQPYLIYYYSHLQLDPSWAVALGGVSLASMLSAGPALAVLKRASKVIAMVVVTLLGPVLPLLIYVHVALYGLYNQRLWDAPYSLNLAAVFIYFGLAALLFHFINLPLDVNSTSMHSFYRDRLSRAYLISREKDDEIVPEDDLSLRDICLEGSGAPYHLINVALNLQGTSDPAMRRRHSDFFTFSRDFIGGTRTGYCKTKHMERVFPHLHLSSAMAVSAAAAAPNMGTFTFGPLVVLMALLNIRLGFWLPNPSRVNLWTRTGTSRLLSVARSIGFTVIAFFGSFRARPGAYALIKEMLSLMHDRSRFVNLSDGGHIENTGAYELLRRRCRFIVIGDAEADPEMSFPGLATLVRYARIDLGVEIEIHVDDLRLGSDGESRQHCAIGVVRYPEEDEPGLLLYVKSSLTGDEDQVVAEYRARSETFPHESTADQAFDEGQFEAYRALGFHIGEGLFDQQVRIKTFEAFRLWFEGLRVTLSPGLASNLPLAEIDAELAEISDLLRQPELESYFYELYPDLKPRDGQPAEVVSTGEAFRLVFHVVDRQLRLMQTLFRWLELGQRGNLAHPSNRGWINLFRRWAGSPTFKRIYLRTISTCSGPFQQFCESALGLRIRFRWRSMRRKEILLAMSRPRGGEGSDEPQRKVGQLVAEMEGVRETLLIGHARVRPGGRVSVDLRDGYQGTGMLAKAELALQHWATAHRVSVEVEMPSEVLPESGEGSPNEIVEPDAEETDGA